MPVVSKHITRWLAGIVAIAMILSATPLVADSKSAPSKVDPALLAAATSRPDAIFSVIVRGAKRQANEPKSAGRSDDLGARVAHAEGVFKGLGASVGRSLGIVGSVAGPLRGKQILELSRSGLVERIVWDERFAITWTASDAATAAASAGIQAVNAPQTWTQTGASGRGIGVAVIDSGVADHPDLAGRIVARVDLTGEGSTGDPGGHGTHVAGLIAGDGTASNGAFTGVAPQANIVSVRVIDSNGYAKLSTIFAGMQWILGHQSTYNIRVVNISFGGTVRSSYADDLLASAAELLNFAGMVTVVSAGNAGPGASTITSPANDPFVITVGADDDAGTAALADDSIPVWSSRGPTAFDAIAKPDLIAPGRHMVSLRVPGSTLDVLMPERQVTAPGATVPSYFMMSGTSMSAPIVAGIAALYIERNPNARPRAVKQQLTATAHALPGVPATDQGSGVVDALAALTANPVPMDYTRYPASHAFADQMFAKLKGQPIVWRDLTFNGGVDSHGITWEAITWESITWDAITWENITWEGFTWDAISFADITLTGLTWESVTWEGLTWETSSPTSLAVQ
ncbi:MAG TPA: S8 family peptidase [Candidatus Limnocylindria bacterium]